MSGIVELKDDLVSKEECWNEELKSHLQIHNNNVIESLRDCVAWICDIPVEEMEKSTSIYASQTRWLFWYAYRTLSAETYGRIGDVASSCNMKYTKDGIRKGVSKMSNLIDFDYTWKKKWLVVKQFISMLKDEEKETKKHKISILVPRELTNKVQIEIKEI